jgi:hypothetical protein
MKNKKKMKKFRVLVREVHVQWVEIESTSEEEAKDRVQQGEGEIVEGSLEYSHTLDSDTWTVEEIE